MSKIVPQLPFNLLVIEDDDVDGEAILRCLRGHEAWRALVVNSAQEAFDILQHQNGQGPTIKPCLILLDLELPGMDGFEFLRILRGNPLTKDCVVVVLSGLATQHNRARADEYGVAEYLVKDNLDSTSTGLVRLLEPYLPL
jgi:CheY-like chemotaxis protein